MQKLKSADVLTEDLEQEIAAAEVDTNGDFDVSTVITVCEDAQQDWFHTFSSIEAALKIFKSKPPHIAAVYLQGINASNYHGTDPDACLRVLTEIGPMIIKVSIHSSAVDASYSSNAPHDVIAQIYHSPDKQDDT